MSTHNLNYQHQEDRRDGDGATARSWPSKVARPRHDPGEEERKAIKGTRREERRGKEGAVYGQRGKTLFFAPNLRYFFNGEMSFLRVANYSYLNTIILLLFLGHCVMISSGHVTRLHEYLK